MIPLLAAINVVIYSAAISPAYEDSEASHSYRLFGYYSREKNSQINIQSAKRLVLGTVHHPEMYHTYSNTIAQPTRNCCRC